MEIAEYFNDELFFEDERISNKIPKLHKAQHKHTNTSMRITVDMNLILNSDYFVSEKKLFD